MIVELRMRSGHVRACDCDGGTDGSCPEYCLGDRQGRRLMAYREVTDRQDARNSDEEKAIDLPFSLYGHWNPR